MRECCRHWATICKIGAVGPLITLAYDNHSGVGLAVLSVGLLDSVR